MPELDADYWEQHHLDGHIGTIEVSPYLRAAIAGLEPGTALDAGTGPGHDAHWLAELGWQVTAVDVSETAVARARAADAEGAVGWQHADVTTWEPTARYDLVTSHHVHTPMPWPELVGRMAGWVGPGGTLLVVGHAHGDEISAAQGAAHTQVGVEETVAVLDPAEWEIRNAGVRERTVSHQGTEATLRETVLCARHHPFIGPDSTKVRRTR